jgi:glycosyltransferase involved in cell wall biosynthesis
LNPAPIRLTVILTHPVQYLAPWFRHIATDCASIDLTVLYAIEPLPEAQAVGFGGSFHWDVPLREGYRSRVLRESSPADHVGSDRALGVDAGGIGRAIVETAPDAVLVPGWHSIVYWRALVACRLRRIPLIYRGDSTLLTTHTGARRLIWRWRTHALLRMFDAHLSVGTRSHDFLKELGAPEYLTQDSPHAVDNGLFAAKVEPFKTAEGRRRARGRFGLDTAEFVALFAGKLEEKKRPLDAVRAAARSSATLLVAGSGPLESAIHDEAGRLNARVRFAGFLNQSELPIAYAAADVLVLPSDRRETWGLVVNEAMAAGVPAIVSNECGCAPDLIVPGETGEVFPVGDVAALADAIGAIRQRRREGHDFAPACRHIAEAHSFARATAGLVTAGRLVARRAIPRPTSSPRVLATCGDMVVPGGLERMTFEALRALVDDGAQVHCIVNSWENSRIVGLVEGVGATWSRGLYFYAIRRRVTSPIQIAQMAWEIARTSAGLLRAAWIFKPTHVLVPEYVTAIRNAPALVALRAAGVTVVLRLGNAPEAQPFFRRLWRWGIAPLVDRFICNSKFTEQQLLAHGVPSSKVSFIYNTAPLRSAPQEPPPARDLRRVVYIGQIIPEKGVLVLLDAVGLLVAKGLDVRMDLVGDMSGWTSPSYGQYRELVRARAERSDLAGRVRFLGWREDIPAILASAGVHCCPSQPEQREGFGIVNVEAKLAGIPSIVTPVGALPELVQHRLDGWVCRDAKADSIAEGLGYFLEDPVRATEAGAAARRSAARFDRREFTRAWRDVFRSKTPAGTKSSTGEEPNESHI